MKKTVLILLVAVFSAAIVNAQGLKFGVKAGFNASNISGFPTIDAGDAGKASNNYKPGFQLGVAAQYMATAQFGLETGLYYSQLGTNYKMSALGEEIGKIVMNPSYLQLPITALYKVSVGQDLYLYPQAGFYLGYGLGGKVKETNERTEEYDIFGKDMETNRFDYGVTFGLNLQYSNYVIGLGYDLGLGKINKEAMEEGFKDMKNTNIKVTLGYFF